MTIKMIACINEGGWLGKDGDLLYYLKKDLANFKKLTTNQIVLMGKNTWNSLPRKPLPNRINAILTSDRKLNVPNEVFLSHSKEQILNHHLKSGKHTSDKDLWVIGGKRLYYDMLEYAEEIHLTRVKDDTVGDVSFPMHKMEGLFNLVEDEVEYHEENGLEFTFEKWIRKDIKDLS